MMFLLCAAAYCVHQKYNTGGWISFVVFLMRSFTVVTIHDVVGICGCLAYISVFLVVVGLYISPIFGCLYVDFCVRF